MMEEGFPWPQHFAATGVSEGAQTKSDFKSYPNVQPQFIDVTPFSALAINFCNAPINLNCKKVFWFTATSSLWQTAASTSVFSSSILTLSNVHCAISSFKEVIGIITEDVTHYDILIEQKLKRREVNELKYFSTYLLAEKSSKICWQTVPTITVMLLQDLIDSLKEFAEKAVWGTVRGPKFEVCFLAGRVARPAVGKHGGWPAKIKYNEIHHVWNGFGHPRIA